MAGDAAGLRLAALELILEGSPSTSSAAPDEPVEPSLEVQLQRAHEYARLCEQRLLQLSPEHELPVLAAHLHEAAPSVIAGVGSASAALDDEALAEVRCRVPKPTVWLPPHKEAHIERLLREERAAHAELRRKYAASESRLRESLAALRDLRSRLETKERELAAAHAHTADGGSGPSGAAIGGPEAVGWGSMEQAHNAGEAASRVTSSARGCSCGRGEASTSTVGAVRPVLTAEGLRADRARLQRELIEVRRNSEARRRKDRAEYDAVKHALAECSKMLGLPSGGERMAREAAASARRVMALQGKLAAAAERESALAAEARELHGRLETWSAERAQDASQADDLSRRLGDAEKAVEAAERSAAGTHAARRKAEEDRAEVLDGYAELQQQLRRRDRMINEAGARAAFRGARSAAAARIQARVLAVRSRRATRRAEAALGVAAGASAEAGSRRADAVSVAAELATTKVLYARSTEEVRKSRLEASRKLEAAGTEAEQLRQSAAAAHAEWEVERHVLLDEIHMARMRAAKAERQVADVQQAALATSHQHKAMLGEMAIAARQVEQQEEELSKARNRLEAEREQQKEELGRARNRLEVERAEVEAERQAAAKRMEEVRGGPSGTRVCGECGLDPCRNMH
jgi:predicted  nucleic acid-binding Zn-ribbon protein